MLHNVGHSRIQLKMLYTSVTAPALCAALCINAAHVVQTNVSTVRWQSSGQLFTTGGVQWGKIMIIERWIMITRINIFVILAREKTYKKREDSLRPTFPKCKIQKTTNEGQLGFSLKYATNPNQGKLKLWVVPTTTIITTTTNTNTNTTNTNTIATSTTTPYYNVILRASVINLHHSDYRELWRCDGWGGYSAEGRLSLRLLQWDKRILMACGRPQLCNTV